MLLKGNLHLSKARGGLPRLGAGEKKPNKGIFCQREMLEVFSL